MDEQMLSTQTVLLVSAMDGLEDLAAVLSERASVVFEVVRSRRAALALLRRRQYAAVLVDASLPATEVTPTEMLWQNRMGAVPLEIDMRVVGAAGLARLLRSVLDGREQMEASVREDVTRAMAEELRSMVTGLLLQSDLMLREKTLSPSMLQRAQEMRALADELRIRLRPAC